MRYLKNNKSGVTLIEVIASLPILVMIVVGLSNYIVLTFNISGESADLFEATQIAQKNIEEYKGMSYSDIFNTMTKISDDTYAITFNEPNHNDYSVTVELSQMPGYIYNNTETTYTTTCDYVLTLEPITSRTIDITYQSDGQIKISEPSQLIITATNTNSSVKLYCKGINVPTNHYVNIYNQTNTPITIYIEKDNLTDSNVNIISREGTILTKNLLNATSSKELIYAIKVVVKKDNKIITSLQSTKRQ